jgi:EAL domain-containing protein (putative c-di-GMP-specific phosphodiesterase class I)
VETEQQLRFLQAERCDQYQGLLFKPPLESAEIFELLP